jgi:hypothetical protein
LFQIYAESTCGFILACSRLRELRLSHSYLGRNGVGREAFSLLVNLEVLDLSENFLATVPAAAKLPSVKVATVYHLGHWKLWQSLQHMDI